MKGLTTTRAWWWWAFLGLLEKRRLRSNDRENASWARENWKGTPKEWNPRRGLQNPGNFVLVTKTLLGNGPPNHTPTSMVPCQHMPDSTENWPFIKFLRCLWNSHHEWNGQPMLLAGPSHPAMTLHPTASTERARHGNPPHLEANFALPNPLSRQESWSNRPRTGTIYELKLAKFQRSCPSASWCSHFTKRSYRTAWKSGKNKPLTSLR